jgi:integrase
MGWVEKRVTDGRMVRWRAGYRTPGGTKIQRTFATKASARTWISANEGAIATGDYIDPTKGAIPFAEFWDRAMSSATLKASTRADYEGVGAKWILPYLGARKLNSIRRTDVADWLDRIRADGASDPTARKAYVVARRVFSRAVKMELIRSNPASAQEVPKPRPAPVDALTDVDLWTLADAVEPRYRALVLVLGYAGPRIGEAIALRVGDFDPKTGRLTIARSTTEVRGRLVDQDTTKTGRVRTVTLPPTIRDEVVRHLARFGDPRDAASRIFTTAAGATISPTNFLKRVVRPAAKRSGLDPNVRVHTLRHTAASLAIRDGWNVTAVQQLLGHASPMITLTTYVHLFAAQSDANVAATEAAIQQAKAARQPTADIVPITR